MDRIFQEQAGRWQKSSGTFWSSIGFQSQCKPDQTCSFFSSQADQTYPWDVGKIKKSAGLVPTPLLLFGHLKLKA